MQPWLTIWVILQGLLGVVNVVNVVELVMNRRAARRQKMIDDLIE